MPSWTCSVSQEPVQKRLSPLTQVGFTKEGKVIALDLNLYNNAGNTLDLSHSVMDRALLHSDNCYKIPHVRAVGHLCKTNTASNTAFRGFGGPQVSPLETKPVQKLLIPSLHLLRMALQTLFEPESHYLQHSCLDSSD